MLVKGQQLQENTDWFLTTPSGDLALRIVDGLSIGEDEDGELELNPKKELRIVCFELHTDSSLAISTGNTLFKFRQVLGHSEDHITIASWQTVRLKMPSCVLTIDTGLASEKPDRGILEIELVLQPDCSAPKFTLTAVEPVDTIAPVSGAEIHIASASPREPDWPQLADTDSQSESDSYSAYGLTHDLSVVAIAPPPKSFSNQKNQGAPIVSPTVPRTETETSDHRKFNAPMFLLVTNLALLIAFVWWATPALWPELTAAQIRLAATSFATQTPGTLSLIDPDPLEVAPPSELLQSIRQLSEANSQQDPATIDFMIQSLETVSATNPSNAEANALLSELTEKYDAAPVVTRSLESEEQQLGSVLSPDVGTTRLEETGNEQIVDPSKLLELRAIEGLISRGLINAPAGNNAVAKLQNLLFENPQNAAALKLMDQCADTLVQRAVFAHRQSREYEARNILEEALAFHPTHPVANSLWHDWVDEKQ